MSDPFRPCWRNCFAPGDERAARDPEIRAIDAMEDGLAPLDEQAVGIRRLITCHESCHHKAARHVTLIVEAIAVGRTSKGPGTRPPGETHPIERAWQSAVDVLSAWCDAQQARVAEHSVGGAPASALLGALGPRAPLMVWQVRRATDRIRQYLDPSFAYRPMWRNAKDRRPLGAAPGGAPCHGEQGFLTATAETIIHDTVDGREAELPLALAIDRLQPCNWNFVQNLAIVLRAIGGDLRPARPFAACARNIRLTPIRERMRTVSKTLAAFGRGGETGRVIDEELLSALGEPAAVKRWLAASLAKTLELQLDL